MSGAAERLFTLGVVTLIPFACSLVPLAMSGLSSNAPATPIGILTQMLQRLFPFSRGLNHAYWAANFWALYTFTDRVLVRVLPAVSVNDIGASASRGIIGDTCFTFLPQISAFHCFAFTIVFTVVISIRLVFKPTQTAFLQAITLFGLTSFLFGFHVHEKAILLALIPLTLLSTLNYFYIRMTLLLSISGIIALFPLLFQSKETPIKYIYSSLWFLIIFRALFASQYRPTPSNWDLILSYLENVYLVGFIPLQAFVSIIHPLWTAGKFEPILEQVALVYNASSSAKDSIASVVSVSVSQATASLSLLAPAEQTSTLNSSFSELIISAGDTISNSSRAVQDHVLDAIASGFEAAKEVIYTQQDHSIVKTANKMEFLPLMMTSVYCALGVTFVWFRLGYRFLTVDEEALSQGNTKTATS